jgi:8-oxo-dGTP pyrophosphatase MutT (NUDIX family)
VRREVFEEARARLKALTPYGLYNLTFVNEVYVMFHGRLVDEDYGPGPESSEVRLVAEAEIPWESLAFSVMRETLRRFCGDRKKGGLRFHMGDVQPG